MHAGLHTCWQLCMHACAAALLLQGHKAQLSIKRPSTPLNHVVSTAPSASLLPTYPPCWCVKASSCSQCTTAAAAVKAGAPQQQLLQQRQVHHSSSCSQKWCTTAAATTKAGCHPCHTARCSGLTIAQQSSVRINIHMLPAANPHQCFAAQAPPDCVGYLWLLENKYHTHKCTLPLTCNAGAACLPAPACLSACLPVCSPCYRLSQWLRPLHNPAPRQHTAQHTACMEASVCGELLMPSVSGRQRPIPSWL